MNLFRQFRQRIEYDGLSNALAWAEQLPQAQQQALRHEIDLFTEVYAFVTARCAERLQAEQETTPSLGSLHAAVEGAAEAIHDLQRTVQPDTASAGLLAGYDVDDLTAMYESVRAAEDIINGGN